MDEGSGDAEGRCGTIGSVIWVVSIALGNVLCAGLYWLTLRTRLLRVPRGSGRMARSATALFAPPLVGSAVGGAVAPAYGWLIGMASVVPSLVVIPFTLLLGGAVAAMPRSERPHFFTIVVVGMVLALFLGVVGGLLGMGVRVLSGAYFE